MTLGRGGVLCWRLVQSVALIAFCGCGRGGQLGRPVDLVMGNGGVMGLKIRAIDRSDCTTFMGFCARPTGATSRLGYGEWGCDGFENQGD